MKALIAEIAKFYNCSSDDYTIISDGAYDVAFAQTKGCFQRSVLSNAPWTGSQLRGKAKNYKSQYMRSLDNLRARLSGAGLILTEFGGRRRQVVIETKEEFNKRITPSSELFNSALIEKDPAVKIALGWISAFNNY